MADSAMPKKTPAKKTDPKKEKRDPSQIALSIVEQVTGGKLVQKKPLR